MNEGSRVLEGYVRLPYRWAMGATTTRFFEEFKKKRIMGTRCSICNRVLIPARSFCSHCFVKTDEWVEVAQEGTLRTWCAVNFSYEGQPKEPPYIIGIIDLDGANVGLPHFVGGVDLDDFEEAAKKIHVGGRMKAVWKEKREGSILDIDYFQPVE
ncbi:MAG: Zn-ribbon domain-containing OB-fold protein [Pseudomonadota bacterium]